MYVEDGIVVICSDVVQMAKVGRCDASAWGTI